MRRCARCGEPLDESADTCPKCGGEPTDETASFSPVPAPERELGEVGQAGEGPVLIVRKGPDVGERFYLDRPQLTVGRDPDSDIFLNDVTVSRSHALLTIAGRKVEVEDTGSLNGTYVNGRLVEKAALGSGDSLQIGRFQMVFLGGGGA